MSDNLLVDCLNDILLVLMRKLPFLNMSQIGHLTSLIMDVFYLTLLPIPYYISPLNDTVFPSAFALIHNDYTLNRAALGRIVLLEVIDVESSYFLAELGNGDIVDICRRYRRMVVTSLLDIFWGRS